MATSPVEHALVLCTAVIVVLGLLAAVVTRRASVTALLVTLMVGGAIMWGGAVALHQMAWQMAWVVVHEITRGARPA